MSSRSRRDDVENTLSQASELINEDVEPVRLLEIDDQTLRSSTADSTKLQIAALETAFEVQEKASATRHQSTTKSILNTTDGLDKIDEFPYVKLLQLWRRQAVRNTFERLQAESRTAATAMNFARERTRLMQQSSDADAAAIAWKERNRAAVSRVRQLEAELVTLSGSLREGQEKRAELQSQIQKKISAKTDLALIDQQLRNAFKQLEARTQAAMISVSCWYGCSNLHSTLFVVGDGAIACSGGSTGRRYTTSADGFSTSRSARDRLTQLTRCDRDRAKTARSSEEAERQSLLSPKSR